MFIGAHVSISKGLLFAAKTAAEMKGNTFQFFTRNPRGGRAKQLEDKDIEEANNFMEKHCFSPIVAHAPYTYNLASVKPEVREFTIRTMKEDLARTAAMNTKYLVVHAGTHGGQGEKEGLRLVVLGLKEILAEISDDKLYVLVEGMAGEGSELGYSFSQLGNILTGCDNHPQLGVCLDSCHLTGAGYDLSNWDAVKDEFDREVGLQRLKVFHLNDSLYPLGSRRDRHAKLGEGHVDLAIIKELVRDKDLQNIPFILETPNDEAGYAREIALIKELGNT